jgi:hypothetical protein
MASEVLYERREASAIITINRPERRNALSIETCHQLGAAWTRFEADADAMVAILTGTISLVIGLLFLFGEGNVPWMVRVAFMTGKSGASTIQETDDLSVGGVSDPRELARRLKGFEHASPQKLFRKFVDTMGQVEIEEDKVKVLLDRRAHDPLLKEAGLLGLTPPVPWLANRPVFLALS